MLASSEKIIEYFDNAEEAWFWFMRCEMLKNDLARVESQGLYERPCSPADIYRMVLKLFRSGKITGEHVKVLIGFGKRFAVPDPRLRAEERFSLLWEQALDQLNRAMKNKGLIYEKNIH